jgi:hypothetical protein
MRGALDEDDYDIVIIDVTSPRLTTVCARSDRP